MILGIRTDEKDLELERFLLDTQKRLSSNELAKNPFINSDIYFLDENNYILVLNPIYPKLTLPFILSGVVGLFFRLKVLVGISLVMVFLSEFLSSKYLYYTFLLKAKKKYSIKSKLYLMKNSEVIELLLIEYKRNGKNLSG